MIAAQLLALLALLFLAMTAMRLYAMAVRWLNRLVDATTKLLVFGFKLFVVMSIIRVAVA